MSARNDAFNYIQKAMQNLNRCMRTTEDKATISFDAFLERVLAKPQVVIRNIFQVFHDMVVSSVGKGVDEYPDDPESIGFVFYDFSQLFVENSDRPFFADRLFANRLMRHVEALRRGAQQNKIYIFDGPPGCGKSTFLNNLLRKFEEYTATTEGMRYEVVWRLEPDLLAHVSRYQTLPLFERLSAWLDNEAKKADDTCEALPSLHPEGDEHSVKEDRPFIAGEAVYAPCPCHDNPLLMIPKKHRRSFFDDLFENNEFKWQLYTSKEYDWVFADSPCTICSSIYDALLERLKNPMAVFDMIYARPYRFNRRLGEGITVFNPGDRPMRQTVFSNNMLQKRINSLFNDSNQVQYVFSRYAKTNNGIYALMDIKSHNTERLIELHNIISEGVHKVSNIEEGVNSLFMAVMNPEDKKNIQDFQSFSDRTEYIRIPYVLDLSTEVEIYRNIFGKHIDKNFLPKVLHNFARVIISTRLNIHSPALLEWIPDPTRYRRYCDRNLQLLKMEIFTGHIPDWLAEEDRQSFTAQRRRNIVEEAIGEGQKGFSGRDSITIFNDFYSAFARKDKLIDMAMLCLFFKEKRKDLAKSIPDGFLESLLNYYDYTVLQQVKECLYYYNEEQIAKDIQNYMFAVNFEPGSSETCQFTGEKLDITEDYFQSMEARLISGQADPAKQAAFRREVQKEYTSQTLPQELLLAKHPVTETELFAKLHERYIYNLKEKVLDPFLENENFRQAVKDFNTEGFRTHDRRIREDVTFLMRNLRAKFRYNAKGAKEICMYVIDQGLGNKYGLNEKNTATQESPVTTEPSS